MRPTCGLGLVPIQWLRVLLAPLSTVPAAGLTEARVSIGVGISIGSPQPSPTTEYLNWMSVLRGQAAYAERDRAMSAVDNSNASYNRVHDPTFFDRFDVEERTRLQGVPSGVRRSYALGRG
jgi:hypothetical protein